MPDIDWQETIQFIPDYDPVATAGLSDCTWDEVCDDTVGDYWFDEPSADNVVGFFHDVLTFTKGPRASGDGGEPENFILEPCQQAIVGNLFGWKTEDGLRRYRECLMMVGRKNGKTPLAAGICNYLLFCEGEPGAEIYGAAADTDGTRELWDAARVQRSRANAMSSVSKVYKSTKTIERQNPYGIFRCVSSDRRRGHSYNTLAAVIDELHLHQNSDLVDAFETSVSAREEPLILFITTRDVERESVCNDKEDYAQKVQRGVIDDPAFLPVLYIPDVEDEWEDGWDERWEDPELWKRANPLLGVSKQWSYMKRAIKKAKERPSRRNKILRLDLNIKTGAASSWVELPKWDKCSDVDPQEIEEAAEWRQQMKRDMEGEACFAGLDLSANRDLTALILWFPEHELVLPWFWIPEVTARERQETEKLPYQMWHDYGFVEYCEGETIDTDLVEERALDVASAYRLQAIGVDRWNSLSIVNHLMNELGEDSVISVGQGYASMSYPMKDLEKRILDGRVHHGANPVLRSNLEAVAVKHKRDEADNIKPDKDKSTSRIDGIVALIMALACANEMPEQPDKESSYIVVG